MNAVSVRFTPDLIVGTTTNLFPNRSYATTTAGAWMYDVSPRDGRFLMLKEPSGGASPISVVVNWFDELTRLAPR